MTTPLCLLDLDGTLMDSAPGITASAAQAYRALGLETPSDAVLRSFVGPPITGSFVAHGVPEARATEAVRAYREEFVTRMIADNAVFDGIFDVLHDLRGAGVLLAVATSKPVVYARPICDAFDLTDRVDAIFGAPLDETPSSKADVVAAALAEFPDAGPVLMVGDREHDVLGARACGVETVGVTWGYAAQGELEAAGAVELVDDVRDLAAVVMRRLGTR
ncbi:HAD hydrolase-like protein [Cellulomonas sp. URHE0023]|uniref:HAD hydrolase-like protein n=1 Tax=Cellulomonas sp. URHE0023 TaxID=1380354 RepID=UPI00054F113E|nr:HAD hydrolase-like protein [Cellulomonas sp. URHE0023]